MENKAIVLNFLKIQAELKIMHFQTINYNEHKVLDSYYESYSETFDKFVECLLFEERTDIKLETLNLELEVTPIEKIRNYRREFLKLTELFQEYENQSLLTILQDLIIVTERTIYLLNAC